jgi:hypothetical protein
MSNGGIIGKPNTPSQLFARGIWTSPDNFLHKSGGTWPRVDVEFDVEFLVIGGGGTGSTLGSFGGSGGGAGGYLSSIVGELGGINPVSLTNASATYSVTVGATGSDSVFSGTDTSAATFNFTAIAGGGATGNTGGSGSGGSPTGPGGSGTANQGNAGSAGSVPHPDCVNSEYHCHSICQSSAYFGGGGGAGTAGSGRDGGDGKQSSVTGTATYYSGGGHGSDLCSINGTAGLGQSNYGGGGNKGATGQDGVVFLKYSVGLAVSNPGGGLTMSTTDVNGYRLTTITAGTGTIAFARS